LRILGGGTRPVGRPVAGEALSVAGLTGVELYEPGALTIVVKGGRRWPRSRRSWPRRTSACPSSRWITARFWAPTGEPTIGGVVAANVSGPRRIQAGACRDSLIGVRFVDGTGTVLKNGGRVMKNVTGYDLVKLLAGSRGTLGVLTEVAFKVLPDTETQANVVIEGLSPHQAVEAMSTALGSPFEVTGAAHLPGARRPADAPAAGGVRGERGLSDRAVERPSGTVRRGAGGDGPDAVRAVWRGVRDVEAFAGKPGDVWRISVKPSDGPDIAALTQGEASSTGAAG
jgi:glycolate oxidase FAD binding subunit